MIHTIWSIWYGRILAFIVDVKWTTAALFTIIKCIRMAHWTCSEQTLPIAWTSRTMKWLDWVRSYGKFSITFAGFVTTFQALEFSPLILSVCSQNPFLLYSRPKKRPWKNEKETFFNSGPFISTGNKKWNKKWILQKLWIFYCWSHQFLPTCSYRWKPGNHYLNHWSRQDL